MLTEEMQIVKSKVRLKHLLDQDGQDDNRDWIYLDSAKIQL